MFPIIRRLNGELHRCAHARFAKTDFKKKILWSKMRCGIIRTVFEENRVMNLMLSLTLALNLGLTVRGGVAYA